MENISKRVLLYFSDTDTEVLYKIWSTKFKIPIINGCNLFFGQNGHEKQLRQFQEVLLFVNVKGFSQEVIIKLLKNGFSTKKIHLFTTYSKEMELCEYAKNKNIRITRLPLYKCSIKDFL